MHQEHYEASYRIFQNSTYFGLNTSLLVCLMYMFMILATVALRDAAEESHIDFPWWAHSLFAWAMLFIAGYIESIL